MIKQLAIACLLLSVSLLAQTAKVIPLSDDDARQAKVYAYAVTQAQKELAKYNELMTTKYLWEDIVYPTAACLTTACKSLEYKPETAKHTKVLKQGWDYGFEYSEDYKFIVPKQAPVINDYRPSGWNWPVPVTGGTLTNVPYSTGIGLIKNMACPEDATSCQMTGDGQCYIAGSGKSLTGSCDSIRESWNSLQKYDEKPLGIQGIHYTDFDRRWRKPEL